MSGLFTGNLFNGSGGLGQADYSDIAAVARDAVGPAKSGGAAYMPGADKGDGGGQQQGYLPTPTPGAATDMSLYAPPATDYTLAYVAGGVAVVGVLGYILMRGGGRRPVTSNRGKRGRRSRLRSRR